MALLAPSACSRAAGPQRLGEYTGLVASVPIPDLLAAPELHLGEEVAVSGSVSQVCQEMGCWFEMAEGGKRLMIDLQMGRRFTIPKDAAGRFARVEGTFVREDGVLKVIGKGVELGRSS